LCFDGYSFLPVMMIWDVVVIFVAVAFGGGSDG
jgi:hypothetical protein